jgi:hypothetical protein
MARGAIDAGKAEAQVHSPSRAMADELGSPMAAGAAMGIEADESLAFSAAKELADGSVYAAERALAAPSGATLTGEGAAAGAATAASSGGREVSVTLSPGAIQINLSGAGADAVPSLQSFFESDFVALLERALEGSGA